MTSTDETSSTMMTRPAPPWTVEGQQDLGPWYEEALRGPRVVYIEALNSWAVFHYDDVEAILRDDVNWSTGRRLMGLPPELQEYSLVSHTVVGSDPPQHTRLRRLITPGFRNSFIKILKQRAEEISTELLDGALERGSFDFTDRYAVQLPERMIAEILGVPVELRDDFNDLMRRIEGLGSGHQGYGEDEDEGGGFVGHVPPAERQAELIAEARVVYEDWDRYIEPVFDQKRQQPEDDMLTALVQAEEGGERLSKRELNKMSLLVHFAGSTTTQTLLGNIVIELARHPEQWARLRADPSLVPNAIEETLRYRAPLHAISRIANNDVVVHGITIPKDRMILTFLQAANRDPAVFDDPSAFDVSRANANRHTSFATGIHFCAGAHLARMEAEVFLTDWVNRVGNWTLDDDKLNFPGNSVSVISVNSLNVTVSSGSGVR